MKKFYIFILITIFGSLIMISCTDNTYNLLKNNVSEIRSNILVYKDDNLFSTFMSGLREMDYKQDGVSTSKCDFAVITLEFADKDYNYNERKVSYSIYIDGKNFTGEMLNNPYDNSFVADLQINATHLDKCAISFSYEDKNIDVELESVTSGWKLNGYEALEVACKDLKEYITQHINDNTLEAEVFIKVVYNNEYSKEYFWYIQIVAENKNLYTVIVNPVDGEIVARNIK